MQTIDQRVVVLEQAANTISAVTINALLAIITSISKLESLDKQALKAELESLKDVHVQNGNQLSTPISFSYCSNESPDHLIGVSKFVGANPSPKPAITFLPSFIITICSCILYSRGLAASSGCLCTSVPEDEACAFEPRPTEDNNLRGPAIKVMQQERA